MTIQAFSEAETRYPEVLGIRSRVLLSVGFGYRRELWALARLSHTQSHLSQVANAGVAVDQIELVALALSLLGLVCRAIVAQAKASLRAQARHIYKSFRSLFPAPRL
jgi:hypothetical protein